MNYYNEFDPYAAQWLRNLIDAGHIPQGEVDSRSIKDVKASELAGFVQCHFFAGLGGWSHALRLAGWPENRPVWTGSCPCQPFSAAGAGGGVTNERHLWPTWFNLIRECRPDVIFGEQVEAAINHGWLDLVQSDLEGEGYACGAVGLPAGGVGAPHIRQRLWFVADAQSVGRSIQHTPHDGSANAPSNTLATANDSVADQRRSDIGELGITQSAGWRTGGEYERGVEMGGGSATPQRNTPGHQLERTDTTDSQLADTTSNGHNDPTRSSNIRQVEQRTGRAEESEVCEQLTASSFTTYGQLADAEHTERRPKLQIDTDAHGRDGLGRGGDVDQLADATSKRGDKRFELESNRWEGETKQNGLGGKFSQLADGQRERLEGHIGDVNDRNEPGRVNAQQARSVAPSSGVGGLVYTTSLGSEVALFDSSSGHTPTGVGQADVRGGRGAFSPSNGFWSDCDWLPCRDGKARPVEPGTFPLAHGVSGRVGRLRAYGNAIVPQVAQVFIEAYLES